MACPWPREREPPGQFRDRSTSYPEQLRVSIRPAWVHRHPSHAPQEPRQGHAGRMFCTAQTHFYSILFKPVSANMPPISEIFPPRDVSGFLVTEVLRPQIDGHRDQGTPIAAQTVFVANSECRPGPILGAVGKAVLTTIYVHCHLLFGDVLQARCYHRLMSPPKGQDAAFLEWDLEVQVRRDERGLYSQNLRIHPGSGLHQGEG